MGAARTTTKMLATALLVAGLTLSAAACGSKDEPATTTTAKSGSSTTEPLATTTTLDDAGYAAFAAEMKRKLNDAGTDPCKIQKAITGISGGAGTPATPEQLKLAVGLTQQMLNRYADAAPPSLAAEAKAVREGGPMLAAAAEANGYSLDWFSSVEAQQAFGPEFFGSFGKIQTAFAEKCNKG
jgi:hypothetical protein